MRERLRRNPDFRPLKIGGRGPVVRTSYWLGRDHLLLVEIAGYVERYRRFYFRDIQALLVQHNRVRTWWNFGFSLLGLLQLAGLLYGVAEGTRTGWQDQGGRIMVMVFSGVLLAFLLAGLINTLRGPTCSVYVRTAIQTQKLHGAARWRKAEQLVNELTPRVHAAQENLVALANIAVPAASPPSSSGPLDPATSVPASPDAAIPLEGGPT